MRRSATFAAILAAGAVLAAASPAAAMYHPTLGRWVQRDPIGYEDGANLHEYASTAPHNGTDPHGLWREVEGQPNIWEAERDGDSLVDLATTDGVNDSGDSWVCIGPKPQGLSQDVQRKMREFYTRQQAPACGRYDVGNLTDSWPRGRDVAFSLHSPDDPTGTKAVAFLGGRKAVPAFAAPALAGAAGNGSTPIALLVLAGHAADGPGMTSSQRENARVFGLAQILGGNLDRGTYDAAVAGKFPPICWFRHDAVVRLVGCRTAAFAQQWAQHVLRWGGVAYGTIDDMDWTLQPAGRSRPYFGPKSGGGEVHQNQRPFFSAPQWKRHLGQR